MDTKKVRKAISASRKAIPKGGKQASPTASAKWDELLTHRPLTGSRGRAHAPDQRPHLTKENTMTSPKKPTPKPKPQAKPTQRPFSGGGGSGDPDKKK